VTDELGVANQECWLLSWSPNTKRRVLVIKKGALVSKVLFDGECFDFGISRGKELEIQVAEGLTIE